MDEYSPKGYDIAQLKFLCETLQHDCQSQLVSGRHGWINDPTSDVHIQLNELIEHIAAAALNFKIKYAEDTELPECIDDYLNDCFMLSSNYGINQQDLKKWHNSGDRLFQVFAKDTHGKPESISF